MKIYPKILLATILILICVAGFFYIQKVFKKQSFTKELISKPTSLGKMKILSPAFTHNSKIPEKYTCDGENVNPPLEIKEIPEGTQSMVLIVEDPDAPMGRFLHWLVFNIPPHISFIEENSIPEGAIQGMNDFGKENYGGPCPPFGAHRYFFKIFSLDKKLDLRPGARLNEVEREMENHILGQAQLIGVYQRK